jgi:sigma-B regulation protein RsbQ
MPATSSIVERNHVSQSGHGTQPMLFAHGFGCDQTMWRFVAPAFEDTHRVICFDHIGCGRADSRAWDADRHASLSGYAQDVLDIVEALDLRDIVLVGHSVSAMIGLLASIQCPERFSRLVLVGPSPRYLNDPPDYVGGFEPADIEALLAMLEQNQVGWADFLVPVVIGSESAPEHSEQLRTSFCAADPVITRAFAAATFLGDNRRDLPHVTVPSLILQVEVDAIAPPAVGAYLHRELAHSTLHQLPTVGHCPHMTHAPQTIAAIRTWLSQQA